MWNVTEIRQRRKNKEIEHINNVLSVDYMRHDVNVSKIHTHILKL